MPLILNKIPSYILEDLRVIDIDAEIAIMSPEEAFVTWARYNGCGGGQELLDVLRHLEAAARK